MQITFVYFLRLDRCIALIALRTIGSRLFSGEKEKDCSLHCRSATLSAWIMRACAGSIFVQNNSTDMSHDVGVIFSEYIDFVASGDEPVDEVAVEPSL